MSATAVKPIPKSKRPARPETASMTLLSYAERCRYSALLALRHRGKLPQTLPMARGDAFHAVRHRIVQMMLEHDETTIPPEVAKDIAQAVMDERTDLNLPAYEQDAVRLMAWNFAEATVINPQTLVGTELLMAVEINGWTVRGKLDQLDISGAEAWIRDSKTSLHLPDQEEFESKIQLPFYALLVAEGILDGKNLPVGGGVNLFHLYEDYPRYRREEDGALWARYTLLTRPEIADFKASLGGILDKLDHSLKTGEWPATPGSHCAICPSPTECPIPVKHRELDLIASWADAERACEALDRLEARRQRLRKSVKGWAQENGTVEFGTDLEFGSRLSVSRSVDREGLVQAALHAANYGEPFDPDQFVKERPSNRFEIRKREVVNG